MIDEKLSSFDPDTFDYEEINSFFRPEFLASMQEHLSNFPNTAAHTSQTVFSNGEGETEHMITPVPLGYTPEPFSEEAEGFEEIQGMAVYTPEQVSSSEEDSNEEDQFTGFEEYTGIAVYTPELNNNEAGFGVISGMEVYTPEQPSINDENEAESSETVINIPQQEIVDLTESDEKESKRDLIKNPLSLAEIKKCVDEMLSNDKKIKLGTLAKALRISNVDLYSHLHQFIYKDQILSIGVLINTDETTLRSGLVGDFYKGIDISQVNINEYSLSHIYNISQLNRNNNICLNTISQFLRVSRAALDSTLLETFGITLKGLAEMDRKTFSEIYKTIGGYNLEQIQQIIARSKGGNISNLVPYSLYDIHQCVKTLQKKESNTKISLVSLAQELKLKKSDNLKRYIQQFSYQGEILNLDHLKQCTISQLEKSIGNQYKKIISIYLLDLGSITLKQIYDASLLKTKGKFNLGAMSKYLRVSHISFEKDFKDCVGIDFEIFRRYSRAKFDQMSAFHGLTLREIKAQRLNSAVAPVPTATNVTQNVQSTMPMPGCFPSDRPASRSSQAPNNPMDSFYQANPNSYPPLSVSSRAPQVSNAMSYGSMLPYLGKENLPMSQSNQPWQQNPSSSYVYPLNTNGKRSWGYSQNQQQADQASKRSNTNDFNTNFVSNNNSFQK